MLDNDKTNSEKKYLLKLEIIEADEVIYSVQSSYATAKTRLEAIQILDIPLQKMWREANQLFHTTHETETYK